MKQTPPDDEPELPAEMPMLDYQSPAVHNAPNADTEWEESRWFSYIAVGIVIVAIAVAVIIFCSGMMTALRWSSG